MKPLRADFVERRPWRLTWALSIAMVVLLCGGAVIQYRHASQKLEEIREESAALQARRDKLLAEAATPDPMEQSARKVNALLRNDLNGLFALVENLNEPGIRLERLDFDWPGQTVRLEYSFDSLSKVAAVTEHLNGGSESKVWHLDLVQSAPSVVQTGRLKGIWRARADAL